MIFWLEKDGIFPDARKYPSQEEEPFCMSNEITLPMVQEAYSKGYFPWYNEDEPVQWWCPDPRFVLFPEELKTSKSMQKILRDELFKITENIAFDDVIKACSTINRKGQSGTWITQDIIDIYSLLHKKGKAKSVEVWYENELVGGFYGIDMGHVFCGESMFSKMSNASKAGFITFVNTYRNQYKIIDCQIHTLHLESLGARSISKREYLDLLIG